MTHLGHQQAKLMERVGATSDPRELVRIQTEATALPLSLQVTIDAAASAKLRRLRRETP